MIASSSYHQSPSSLAVLVAHGSYFLAYWGGQRSGVSEFHSWHHFRCLHSFAVALTGPRDGHWMRFARAVSTMMNIDSNIGHCAAGQLFGTRRRVLHRGAPREPVAQCYCCGFTAWVLTTPMKWLRESKKGDKEREADGESQSL